MKKYILFICLFVIFASLVSAQNGKQYHLKLLAVQEDGKEYQGSDADLYLELKEGSGRVFLETYPLTKFDTQISTRFAKDIACNHFKLHCDQYDFIYTIKAKTNIIGGPSAGAAIAVLTTIGVLDLNYDQNMAITGTINSGGIIGPVGGVKAKLEAASKAGMKKVLIPQGTSLHQPSSLEEGNQTNAQNATQNVNLVEYGKNNLSLDVIEVLDLDEVILQFTDVDLNHKNITLEKNEAYQEIMKKLQDELCLRTIKLEEQVWKEKIIFDNETLASIEKKKHHAQNATEGGDFYSAASFCFGANIELRTNLLKQENTNRAVVTKNFMEIEKKMRALEKKVDAAKIETISDLQTYMIVKERLDDVKQQLQKFEEQKRETPVEEWYNLLAYAEERYLSAVSWMQFFDMAGKKYVFNGTQLQKSCEQKITESEERHQYVSLFIGAALISHIQEKIDDAKEALNNNEFALCLITAAQAKADADAILSSLGVPEEALPEYVQSKQRIVERIIAENSAEGTFPILGYSYYQYANSLRQDSPSTALLYLEYALEMSDLGIYFPEEKQFLEKIESIRIKKEWVYLAGGILLGGISMFLIMKHQKPLYPRRSSKIEWGKKF